MNCGKNIKQSNIYLQFIHKFLKQTKITLLELCLPQVFTIGKNTSKHFGQKYKHSGLVHIIQ